MAGLGAACLLWALLAPLWTVATAQTTDGVVGDEVSDAVVVARIHFATPGELHHLAATLDVWEVDHGDGYVVAPLQPQQVQALRADGFSVTRAVDQQATWQRLGALRAQAAQSTPAHDDGIPGFPCYRSVEETYADMAQLAADHPTLATWRDIGDSWDRITPGGSAGYDLRALVLTNRASDTPKFRFLLLAAIHAREMTTAETAARFAEELVAQYRVDPDVTWLLDYGELHIIPIGNPDGRKWAEQGYFWRKNTNTGDGCVDPNSGTPLFPDYGVDLNRNSSFKWTACQGTGCSSGDACSLTFRGSAPASEPETQAIQEYGANLFADRRGELDTDAATADTSGLFISLHSYGQLVLYPWGWTGTAAPNHAQLETLGRKFGYFTDYQVCQAGEPGCIYQTDGTTDDWSYGELGVASYTFELGTEFFQSCSYFEERILDDMLAALRYAFKAARRPYQTPTGPETMRVELSHSRVVASAPVTLTAVADDSRFDSNGWGDEPVQPIAAVRYTVDAPAWLSGTQTYTLAALDGAFDSHVETVQARLDTHDWAPGRHMIFVESRDADGNWGVPSARFLHVSANAADATLRVAAPTRSARPGAVVTYEVRVANTGIATDTFTPTVASSWPATLPDALAPLAPDAAASFQLRITTPATATAVMTETVSIAVTSQNDGGPVATAELVTRVEPYWHYLPWAPRGANE